MSEESQKAPPPAVQVMGRIISVDRVGIGPGPFVLVVEALGAQDSKAIIEALAAIGVRRMP